MAGTQRWNLRNMIDEGIVSLINSLHKSISFARFLL